MREDGVITFDGDDDWKRRPRAISSGKKFNRKQYRVKLFGLRDPDGTLLALWEHLQPGRSPTQWHVAGGEVHDSVLHLGMVYDGIGGAPSDIEKQLGRLIQGMRFTKEQCAVEHVSTEILDGP